MCAYVYIYMKGTGKVDLLKISPIMCKNIYIYIRIHNIINIYIYIT